jgi:hypothetical protein
MKNEKNQEGQDKVSLGLMESLTYFYLKKERDEI